MLSSLFRQSLQLFLLISSFASPLFCSAAESPPTLTVTAIGARLYARQSEHSDIIATLERGEELMPLGQAVGIGLWYMVKTPKGIVGWIQAADVQAGDRLEKTFRESASPAALGELSTWSAKSRSGRAFAGTWTAAADPSFGIASGTWTLEDDAGKAVMTGTWSASKSAKGWSGSWSALAANRSGEYSGTWSANVRLARDARFSDLFEAAVTEAVSGSWKSGPHSGSWSIRAGQ